MNTHFQPNHVHITGTPVSGKTNTLIDLLLSLPTVDGKGLTRVVDVHFISADLDKLALFRKIARRCLHPDDIPFENDLLYEAVSTFLISKKNINLTLETNASPQNSVYDVFKAKLSKALGPSVIGFSYVFIDGMGNLGWYQKTNDKEQVVEDLRDYLVSKGYSTRTAL